MSEALNQMHSRQILAQIKEQFEVILKTFEHEIPDETTRTEIQGHILNRLRAMKPDVPEDAIGLDIEYDHENNKTVFYPKNLFTALIFSGIPVDWDDVKDKTSCEIEPYGKFEYKPETKGLYVTPKRAIEWIETKITITKESATNDQ